MAFTMAVMASYQHYRCFWLYATGIYLFRFMKPFKFVELPGLAQTAQSAISQPTHFNLYVTCIKGFGVQLKWDKAYF